ncbi:disulfide bond formation protein DsbB [Psychrosphaera aestuarii]|uniref:disulfide bond formation protein DsbB n=1 Tax=Psychrosphaera aestuarii TaxID=1266052 RepID=UPI001B33CCE9|nr:disulfide bond formation protein DsbB [Psychrosphaera aestuarii]
MSVVNNLSTWPASRWPWFILALSALVLELTALYFQYGMGLEPCIMCVYQRVAVLGVLIAAIPALIRPDVILFRAVSFLAWIVASVWGLKLAIEHVRMQNPDNFMLLMTCDIYPNFPSWLQLHQWFPNVFEPRGTCGDIDWVFLSLSMPQWMVITFSIYFLTAIFFLFVRLVKNKSL